MGSLVLRKMLSNCGFRVCKKIRSNCYSTDEVISKENEFEFSAKNVWPLCHKLTLTK